MTTTDQLKARITAALRQSGLSQHKFAVSADLNPQTLRRYLAGQTWSAETEKKLEAALRKVPKRQSTKHRRLTLPEDPARERIRQHLQRAVDIVGSQLALANRLGCSPSVIATGKRLGRVTAELALAIDRAFEGRVSKIDLRPDLFAPDQPATEETANAR